MVCSLKRSSRAFQLVLRLLGNFYLWIMGRTWTQSLNERVLNLALRARGFDNCCDHLTSGEYEFVHQLSKFNPKLCVDVGANVGEYSELLLQKTNAFVFAFEPLPEAFVKLNSLSSNSKNHLIAVNVGLGNIEGHLDLKFGENSHLASFAQGVQEIGYVARSNTKAYKARVAKLDTFMEQMLDFAPEVDLLKIDVEGFEWEVLLGARNTIEKMRPKLIQIEFNLHQLFVSKSILQFSKLLQGYKLAQMLPKRAGLVKRDPGESLSNLYSYSNYVFVRSDFWSEFFQSSPKADAISESGHRTVSPHK